MKFTPEDVRSFFQAHWTVRKYKPFAMPADHLDAILYAAQRAPTDATAQLYSIVRLSEPSLREKIAKLANNPHISTASEAFILCADFHRIRKLLETRRLALGYFPNIAVHFGIGDAVMAGENMLIAAEMLGYRGCWIGGVLNAMKEISELISLPENTFPFAGFTLGVPDEPAQERPRLPRTQVVHENTYQTPSSDALAAAAQDMNPITPRGDWIGLLSHYFGKGGSMEERELLLKNFLQDQFDP
jgi:nitroreductase